jgi:translation initiation factor 2-alpha kinase 3
MSSFFRKPDDTGTDDSTYDDNSSDEVTGSNGIGAAFKSKGENATTKALRKVVTVESTASSDANTLSRQLTVDHGAKQETTEWLMRALLEEKCLNDAITDFEARNTTSKPYTKDHPDVRALADAKYEHMVDMLGRASILPSGPERRDSAGLAIRQQARAGLDYLTSTSPQPGRPGLIHRDTSLLSLHSNIRNAITTQPELEPASQMPFYRQEALNHSMDAVMRLPPVLRPFVDHPMFEMSRYLRDFVEVGMIGKGGFGRVYHVQHRLDGSNYAVKKINLNQHRLKRIQERGQAELDSLLNELRMLAKFDHPNILNNDYTIGSSQQQTSARSTSTPRSQH